MKYQNNGSELLWVFTIIVFNGGYSLNVTCSIIYLSFMDPALIKTIKLLMMSSLSSCQQPSFVCY